MYKTDPNKTEKIFYAVEFVREAGFKLLEEYPENERLRQNVLNIGLIALEMLFEFRFAS